MSRPHFCKVDSDEQRLLRFATVAGFIGMLRPHSLEDLNPESFTAVTSGGEEIAMPKETDRFHRMLYQMYTTRQIMGVYITFQSKTMKDAKAYLPLLASIERATEFSLICPILALLDISGRGLLKRRFLKGLNRKKRLTYYLQYITGLEHYIAPYALRIGGRTWLLAQGLDRQFVDFLGTWKSPEASARYYRAAPNLVLRSLERFYLKAAKWQYVVNET